MKIDSQLVEAAARELCAIRKWSWEPRPGSESLGDRNFERNNAIREVQARLELDAAIETAKNSLRS